MIRITSIVTLVLALQVEEQIRIYDPIENPSAPSSIFLKSLSNRQTLVLGNEIGDYSKLLKFLTEDRGHNVTINGSSLLKGGIYMYDSILVLGSDGIKNKGLKAISYEQLLSFYDIRWVWHTYDKYPLDVGKLKLPPALALFADPCGNDGFKSCEVSRPMKKFLQQLGFSPILDTGTKSWNMNSSLIFPSIVKHSLFEANNQSMNIQKLAEMEDGNVLAALISGQISLSRALLVASNKLCNDDNFDANRKQCEELLDNVMHKKNVSTWANLQHSQVVGGLQFDEYTGEETSKFNENDVKLTTRSVYTIRDELVVSVDIYDLEEIDKNEYDWVPAKSGKEFYYEYRMMVPYVRHKLERCCKSSSSKVLNAAKNKGLIDGLQENVTFWAHFKAPTQHGIFKLILKPLNHNNPIWVETLMPLRTYMHYREQPARIFTAYPYYTGLFSATLAFAVVCSVLLTTK